MSLAGLPVSRLSLGGAALGNLFTPVDDEAAAATVAQAWTDGIRYFDTAPHYGLGLSERRLGQALRGLPRAEYVVSTKVGRLLVPVGGPVTGTDEWFAVPATHRRVWDFSASGIRRSVEESLDRLGIDRIDIAFIHDPDDHEHEAFTSAYPELERMRSEGIVTAIGAGMNQSAMLTRFVRETDVDAVLLAGRYTLLDQSAAADLLPVAEERGVSVVIGGVFNSGLLAAPRPHATYDYRTAPPELVEKALRMKAVCDEFDVPLRAAALAFPGRHPSVASVLVGARSAAEVADAVRQAAHPIPPELWDALAKE